MRNFFTGNPIFMRYWRSNMRPQTFVPSLGLLIIALYMIFLATKPLHISEGFGENPAILVALIGLQAIILQLFGAIYVFFHITRAKESNMIEFLRITPLSSKKTAVGLILGAPIACIILGLILLPIILITAHACHVNWMFYPVYLITLVTSTLLLYTFIAFLSYILKGKIVIFLLIIALPIFISLLSTAITSSSIKDFSATIVFLLSCSFVPLSYIAAIGEDIIQLAVFAIIQQLFYTIFIFDLFSSKIKSTDSGFITRRSSPIVFFVATTIFMISSFIISFLTLSNPDDSEYGTVIGGEAIMFGIILTIFSILFTFAVVPNKEKVIKWAIRFKGEVKTGFVQKYIFNKDAPATNILIVYSIIAIICLMALSIVCGKINQNVFGADLNFVIAPIDIVKYGLTLIYCGCLAQYFNLIVPKYSAFYTGLILIIIWLIIPTIGSIGSMWSTGAEAFDIWEAFLPFIPSTLYEEGSTIGLHVTITLTLTTFILAKIAEMDIINKTKNILK